MDFKDRVVDVAIRYGWTMEDYHEGNSTDFLRDGTYRITVMWSGGSFAVLAVFAAKDWFDADDVVVGAEVGATIANWLADPWSK